MRILVGSLQQETNSFSPRKSTAADFYVEEGPSMLAKIAATPVFREAGAELAPSLYAHAVPSGPLAQPDFWRLADRIVSAARAAGPLDGVWLYLHGALEVEGLGSGEAALLRALRKVTGSGVPYALALDFHANNDPALCGLANIICGYRTAPHRDMEETQRKAARLLVRAVRERLLPVPVLRPVPVIIAGDTVITDRPPYTAIDPMLEAMEAEPGILSASLFNGQNWADSPNNRATVIAVAASPAEAPRAGALAEEVADAYFRIRREFAFAVPALDPAEALELALARPERPVFLSDSGDNATAGAAGSRTDLLAMALGRGAGDILFGGVCDRQAYRACASHAPGDVFPLAFGESGLDCPRARLVRLGTVLGWDGEDGGPGAVAEVEGCTVIVTEKRCAFVSPAIFRSMGVEPGDFAVVVVKLGYLYPDLEPVAGFHVIAKTQGASSVAVERIPFTRITRPCWPLDDWDWKAGGEE